MNNYLDRDRQAVNIETENNPHPCLPVSIEFFNELLTCLPPAYYDATDDSYCYSLMQVGEAADLNAKGEEVFETFMRMNEIAIEKDCADSRMTTGQWYFVGQQKLFIKK